MAFFCGLVQEGKGVSSFLDGANKAGDLGSLYQKMASVCSAFPQIRAKSSIELLEGGNVLLASGGSYAEVFAATLYLDSQISSSARNHIQIHII